ncbi:MAG TPA: tRNA uridine-5-carboxymethylaminomethyl(34) synthesis GTPase MnmE [Vicinamibacterales bacterium]
MFSTTDTIVAIATPQGRGGIGVVRVSGPQAGDIARALTRRGEPLAARHATLVPVSAGGATIDRAVLTFFPAPHSYTGEDVLEISAHGSPVLLRAIVEAAMTAGARLAEPGEFTLRAYLHGRLDLVQAEAVRDLVDAVTPLQARAAFDQLEGTLTTRIREVDALLFDLSARLEASLDFSEEGYHFVAAEGAAAEIARVIAAIDELLADARRGRLVREGAQVAIVGRPNAGKSSLFNQLAGAGRAIVTAIPGTTRDLLTETIDIDGIPMTVVDTAGVRGGEVDVVEAEGITRAHSARRVADLTLLVLDGSAPLTPDDRELLEVTRSSPRVIIVNKVDLGRAWARDELAASGAIAISALTGEGLPSLRQAVVRALGGGEARRDRPAITNARHADLLARARAALERAAGEAARGTPEEFVAADVTEARVLLEQVTGSRTPDDVLHEIFSKFCIGK